jgi:hypothetical protein
MTRQDLHDILAAIAFVAVFSAAFWICLANAYG